MEFSTGIGFFLVSIFFMVPFWRIYQRAGLNPYLTLLLFLPFGFLITGIILAASKWKVGSVPSTEV